MHDAACCAAQNAPATSRCAVKGAAAVEPLRLSLRRVARRREKAAGRLRSGCSHSISGGCGDELRCCSAAWRGGAGCAAWKPKARRASSRAAGGPSCCSRRRFAVLCRREPRRLGTDEGAGSLAPIHPLLSASSSRLRAPSSLSSIPSRIHPLARLASLAPPPPPLSSPGHAP
jgi:hypothetical protein